MPTKEAQLLKKLQQAFKAIFELEGQVVASHRETNRALTDIENLCEQLQCVQKIKFEATPLEKYEDLQSRLNHKLCCEIQCKIQLLQDYCDQLGEFIALVEKHHQAVMHCYASFAKDLEIMDLCHHQATRPSATAMMEWLEDLNQDTLFLYEEQQELLLNFDSRSKESVRNLVTKWKFDSTLRKKFSDLRLYLKYFLEEAL